MNTFYKISEEEIKNAEEQMGLSFPSELKELYLTKGYGFLDSKVDNFNRIMDPLSVADFRLHQNEYANLEDIDLYDSLSDQRLVFFEVSEGFYLSIEITTKHKQKIFAFDKIIADSLQEFFDKYQMDESIVFS